MDKQVLPATNDAPDVLNGPLVPIEQLARELRDLPQALSGRYGVNRMDIRPQIAADTDLEAVQSWLVEYQSSPETFRSYRREAERLILWCWFSQGKALSDLNRQDIGDYLTFLKQPEPRHIWCGEPQPRHSPLWKPFRSGLSSASQKQSLTILKGLFKYLQDADYLRGNPFALIRGSVSQGHSEKTPGKKIERYLEQADIDHLFRCYKQPPEAADADRPLREWMREKTLLCFLYYLAPRASEVAACRMNDFFIRRGRWWWRVEGKGKKYAEIPVPEPLMQQIKHYRGFLGLEQTLSSEDDSPFIRSVRGTRGISANMVYRLSKKILNTAAARIESEAPEAAERMRKASTHWFRHTAITHLADQGVDLRLVSKTARHSQLETTAIYFHAEDEAWHDAISDAVHTDIAHNKK